MFWQHFSRHRWWQITKRLQPYLSQYFKDSLLFKCGFPVSHLISIKHKHRQLHKPLNTDQPTIVLKKCLTHRSWLNAKQHSEAKPISGSSFLFRSSITGGKTKQGNYPVMNWTVTHRPHYDEWVHQSLSNGLTCTGLNLRCMQMLWPLTSTFMPSRSPLLRHVITSIKYHLLYIFTLAIHVYIYIWCLFPSWPLTSWLHLVIIIIYAHQMHWKCKC